MFEAFRKSLAEAREQAEAEERAKREAEEERANANSEAKEPLQRYRAPSSAQPSPPPQKPPAPHTLEYVAGNSTWEYCTVIDDPPDPFSQSGSATVMYVDATGSAQMQSHNSSNALEVVNKLGRSGWEAFSSSITFSTIEAPVGKKSEMKRLEIMLHIYSLRRRI